MTRRCQVLSGLTGTRSASGPSASTTPAWGRCGHFGCTTRLSSDHHRIGRRHLMSEIGKPQARSYFAAAQAFRDGADTPRAFLERCIATIEALDPQVGAFVATNLPAARTAADAATARWRSRTALSLIDGMPIGIKDIMETADMVTEQGSPLFAGWRGRRDAAAVAALREAGAVILGKAVT